MHLHFEYYVEVYLCLKDLLLKRYYLISKLKMMRDLVCAKITVDGKILRQRHARVVYEYKGFNVNEMGRMHINVNIFSI